MTLSRSSAEVLCCLAIAVLFLAPAVATEKKAYGEPLTGSDTIMISVLLANSGEFVGQTVRVEGLVTAVCEKRGCWMTLASDKESEELRIKVDDGVIVFPVHARGKHAIAEGIFTRIEMTLEETLSYRAHQAEEQGEEFDPGSVSEPLTYFQIKATGALIG